MSSNRELRKKLALIIEDEIFTINTEVDNLIERLKELKYKELKKLNYAKLKSIRDDMSWIKSKIKHVNTNIDTIDRPCHIDKVVDIGDVSSDIAPNKIILDSIYYSQLMSEKL